MYLCSKTGRECVGNVSSASDTHAESSGDSGVIVIQPHTPHVGHARKEWIARLCVVCFCPVYAIKITPMAGMTGPRAARPL